MKGDRNSFDANGRRRSITPAAMIGVFVIGVVAVFHLAGCGGSEKSRFYMLDPLVSFSPTQPVAENLDIDLGIGPVEIPEYLNRAQIVTRTGRYEVDVAEFDRWAEALEASIPRVLAENLSVLLDSDTVYPYPWVEKAPEYQLRIEIVQFDGNSYGNVELTARWTLLKTGGEGRILQKKFSQKKPIAGQGYSGMVSAMSLALFDLSREIAENMRMEGVGAE